MTSSSSTTRSHPPHQHHQSPFRRLKKRHIKVSSGKARIGATTANFPGYTISAGGYSSNYDKVAVFTRIPMPTDKKQLRSLLGGIDNYGKFLPNISRHLRLINALLKQGATFDFTLTMETTVRNILLELAKPPILVYPVRDAVGDNSRPFPLLRHQPQQFPNDP